MVGVCFGQDVYPYFSDMEKQLVFERKKITIEKNEGVEQVISGGGSEFNWLLKTFDIHLDPTYFYLRLA